MKRILTIFAVILLTLTAFSQDLLRMQHYSHGNMYRAITLKDYNNDGIVDVWSGNSSNNHVEIWTWSSVNDTLVKVDSIVNGFPSPPYYIHNIAAADLDKDGDIDAVVSFRMQGTYLCINNGSGSWTVSQLDGTYGWQAVIEDYDNDGNPDILLSTDYSYLKIYYGDGSGSFASGEAPSDGGSAVCHGVNAVDIDNDGNIDVIGITQNYTDNNKCFLRAYINNLDETTPSWSSSIASGDILSTPNRVQSSPNSAGDLNNDGYIDQVYFSPDNGNIIVMMGDGSGGNLTWQPDTVLKDYSSSFTAVTLIDIDSDGDLDIVGCGYDKFEGVVLLRNDGNGNFTLDEGGFDFGLGSYHDVNGGDIDGNGAIDVIGARYDNGNNDGFEIFFFEKNVESNIVYVNQSASGNNNGTSWDDAYTDLQTALSNAEEGDTIWVAAGEYKPSVDKTGNASPADERNKTFQLKKKVPLFGGFAGTEESMEQRDWKTNQTILSGDIGVIDDNSDNSYNVLNSTDSTYIDGFVITRGKADGSDNNFTDMGAGMNNNGVSDVAIMNCLFVDNFARQAGGIGNFSCGENIVITGCKFLNNTAGAGGGIGNWNSHPLIEACEFYHDTARVDILAGYGGAIYNWGAYSNNTEIVNCTFYENYGDYGASIHNRAPVSNCINSIFWGGTGSDEIYNTNGGSSNVTYSDIDQDAYASGTGCINSDPLLHKVTESEYQLQSNSPCIDAGDPDPVYNDEDGTRNDMGAHHEIMTSTNIVYVNQSASGNNNGTSWDDAYTDLQTALSNAEEGDTIWVAAGEYKPSVDKTGNASPADERNKTFQLKKKVPLFGGFAGTEESMEQRDWKTNQTILSGDIGVIDDNSDNSYNVLNSTDSTYIDGFVVTRGRADGNDNNFTDMGAGMNNNSVSNVAIMNCLFVDNFAGQAGGIGNFSCGENIVITGCKFLNNTAGAGGGIGNWNSHPLIEACEFYHDTARVDILAGYGGAIYNWGAYSNNTKIVNCTFYENYGDYGASIHNRAPVSICKNSILWGGTGSDEIYNTNGGSSTVTYTDIDQDAYASGTGCINSDPLLYKVTESEYKLQSNSPCIDAGDPDPVYNDEDGTRNDMGAHHEIMTSTVISKELNSDGFIQVYPNPVKDILKLKTGQRDFNALSYRLFDMGGRLIMEEKVSEPEISINMQALPSSVYFLKIIEEGNEIKTFKIIKR